MRITGLTHRLVRLVIAAVTVAVAAPASVNAQQGATYEVVSSFDHLSFPGGREPSSLRQATDGTFYGTTAFGGLFDDGVLFQMDVTGVVTPLHSFFDAEGSQPFGLVRASNGRFYGLTERGGQFGHGTVFTFTPGSAPATVHAFSNDDFSPGTIPSQVPWAVDLFAAGDGNVYGLMGGGITDNGTIFVIDPGGSYRTLLTIPPTVVGMTSLVRASDGRFYVTAQRVPVVNDIGVVFTIDDAGTVTIIHHFHLTLNDLDGFRPIGLMQRSDGRLYGTTRSGGAFSNGTVYTVDLDGTYRQIHSFDFAEGGAPAFDLVEASDGNLYGLTSRSLFRIDSSDTLTTLQSASGPLPVDLTLGTGERLYGPTTIGGLDGGGTIITSDLAGTRTTIHQFSIGEGPAQPTGVIQARDGTFYGTTSGLFRSSEMPATGTVFAMDAAGTRTTLHTFFSTTQQDGSPIGHLFEGTDGAVYGTTYTLKTFSFPPLPLLPRGAIFRIGPDGLFGQLSSPRGMEAGVIQARDGRLYGVTTGDPATEPVGGVVRVEAGGGLTTIHAFGINEKPVGELVEIDDGSFYGATVGGSMPVSGTIFQVNPATRAFATRHSFTDGVTPAGRLIQGTDGLLYGTTVNGGLFGAGTVFSLDVAGTLTTLHHFSGADGANPNAGVIQGLDGRLYGVTRNGGGFGFGTVFVTNVTGGLTTLHDFALSDGANPVSELFQANDGAFYGAAPAGGPKGGGVIFRVRLDTSPADSYYEIVSRNSGKCLDVFGASADAAASVIQWVCHGGENQQWRLEPAGGGAVRLIARHSGQVLDVYGALLDDVTPVIQWPVHGGDNQAWTLEPASDGYVSIVARHSGKALDVELASIDDGARVIQYTPHGGANQQWLLRAVAPTASSVTP
jgi:uncharacterized repeat protein (TIGR03803 family)